MASKNALENLKNPESDLALVKICDCNKPSEEETPAQATQLANVGELPASQQSDATMSDGTTSTSATQTSAVSSSPPTSFASDVSSTLPSQTASQQLTVRAAPTELQDAFTSEAEIQQEELILESFNKDEANGDFFDDTEAGFASRAQVAVELFDPVGRSNSGSEEDSGDNAGDDDDGEGFIKPST